MPDYEERSNHVRTLFSTSNVNEAISIAHRLRVDYLYVDTADIAAYPGGIPKFEASPAAFERVFANGEDVTSAFSPGPDGELLGLVAD